MKMTLASQFLVSPDDSRGKVQPPHHHSETKSRAVKSSATPSRAVSLALDVFERIEKN
jgi:hypothetical protein